MPWTKIAVDNAIDGLSVEGASGERRALSYGEAIREALDQALKRDPHVLVIGEGVDDPGGIFGSTRGLHQRFPERVLDMPIAENALTGICTGAALCGLRPVLVHMRMDFMLLSLDQIFNHAAKIRYMSGGKMAVPLVIRSIIGRGWGSAAQHSQALHALFLHMPGIKVAMPSSAYDVKGLLLSSIAERDPVIFIEHRWLYDIKGHVPEQEYLIPFGRASLRREGKDVTIVALSWMVEEAMKAAKVLKEEGVEAEIVDPRSLNPLDTASIVKSVAKTGRLLIADLGWRSAGVAEIMLGRLHAALRPLLKTDAAIVALPDAPTPSSVALEKAYYKDSADIVEAVRRMF